MTANVYRALAAVLCVYFSLAALGKTGSYFEGFSAAVLFVAIFLLGVMSAKGGK